MPSIHRFSVGKTKLTELIDVIVHLRPQHQYLCNPEGTIMGDFIGGVESFKKKQQVRI